MQTQLNEPIEVLATFRRGAIQPLLFRWQGRLIKIDTIELKYDFKKGEVRHFSYAITCSGSCYKITLNTQTLGWMLEEVWEK